MTDKFKPYIPKTYEQFVLDNQFEQDQKIADSYVTEINAYNDIGIQKGYGPCKNSLCGCSCSSYSCTCTGESMRVEDTGTSVSVFGRTKDAGSVFGKAGGQISASAFGYKDDDGELKVLSGTAGFNASFEKGIKAKLSVDAYNVKHDGVQVRVGASADTGISIDKGLEVKALGTGFSVGKDHIGISLPFGEIKLEW